MTAKILADIKPSGLRQIDLVDLLYGLTYSLQGLCDKLDADDASVTTYASGCFDAVFNCRISDSKGHEVKNVITETSTVLPFKNISVNGIGDREMLDWMYEWTRCFYLMCVKLDGSAGVNDTNYTTLCYNAYLTQRITNSRGNSTGYGTGYTFHPGGVWNQNELVEFLYKAAKSLDVLAAKLDLDATLTDTDYESLWYTATILLTIENAAGSRIGN